MQFSQPDLSTIVLMVVGVAAILVARRARQRCAALMPAARAGDAGAVVAGKRQSTVAMVAIGVGILAWLAVLGSVVHL